MGQYAISFPSKMAGFVDAGLWIKFNPRVIGGQEIGV